jgi:2-dehydro-3-deoxygalactonokinase
MKLARDTGGSHFLSCDWGTTSFRLRLVARPGLRVLGAVTSTEGAKTLHGRLLDGGRAADADAHRALFAAVLSDAVARLSEQHPAACAGAPVIVSGMASSTVGWRELPYAPTPCPLDGSGLRVEAMESLVRDGTLHRVWMISGLTTGTDILRGEETEALGLLGLPAFKTLRPAGRLVLPGTHSKHLVIRDGAIVDFHTHLTGELLELLSTRSLLSVSVLWPPPPFEDGDPDGLAAFRAGVQTARSTGLGRGLFQVRVRSVLDHTPPANNARFLAGLLVGSELLDLLAARPAAPTLLAASAHFLAPYRLALETLGARRLRIATPEQVALAAVAAHALVLDRLTAQP